MNAFSLSHRAMENGQPVLGGNVSALLIAMGSASFVVTVYHLVILCRNQRHVTNHNTEQERVRSTGENALVPHLIPAHKYEKRKKSNDDEDEDGTCSVCLGDFEEGEELRTLPECMHSFHVTCIDTWLHSHSSCPVCRAHAAPSPALLHPAPEFGSTALNAHHTLVIGQIPLVQNELPSR